LKKALVHIMMFDHPRLMYIHWEKLSDPERFARDSFNAAKEAGLF